MMFKRYAEFTEQAKELKKEVDANFSDDVLYEGFCNSILSILEDEEVDKKIVIL